MTPKKKIQGDRGTQGEAKNKSKCNSHAHTHALTHARTHIHTQKALGRVRIPHSAEVMAPSVYVVLQKNKKKIGTKLERYRSSHTGP
jgi:hypothetical protein